MRLFEFSWDETRKQGSPSLRLPSEGEAVEKTTGSAYGMGHGKSRGGLPPLTT